MIGGQARLAARVNCYFPQQPVRVHPESSLAPFGEARSDHRTFSADRERYEIRGVMGPDEYHDAYPGAEEPGLNNNAYTDLMAVWVLYRALEILVIRLDRVLEAEGDSPNRYKASKQADVLMLFYLFSSEELSGLFERLGYPFRTRPSPTTSPTTAAQLARLHPEQARAFLGAGPIGPAPFLEAVHRGPGERRLGRPGRHHPRGDPPGAGAGTVDLLQRAFTGLEKSWRGCA